MIIANALGLLVCGGWMVEVAKSPVGVSWHGYLGPMLMVAVNFIGLAVTMWKSRERAKAG